MRVRAYVTDWELVDDYRYFSNLGYKLKLRLNPIIKNEPSLGMTELTMTFERNDGGDIITHPIMALARLGVPIDIDFHVEEVIKVTQAVKENSE